MMMKTGELFKSILVRKVETSEAIDQDGSNYSRVKEPESMTIQMDSRSLTYLGASDDDASQAAFRYTDPEQGID